MKKHAAPIITAILLLLPVLYVGSYLALVTPGVYGCRSENAYHEVIYAPYRWQGWRCSQVLWPLEMIDRKLRPGAWEPAGFPTINDLQSSSPAQNSAVR